MGRVRSLELLFNLEKAHIKSKEDCVVILLHCLLTNENLDCVGTGDEWPPLDSFTTELLPSNWNVNEDVYSLRYSSKDKKSRILLKATKMEHLLQVDAVLNEDIVASLPIQINMYVSDNYRDYSTAYKELDSFIESFQKDIIEKLNEPKTPIKKKCNSPSKRSPSIPTGPPRPSSSPFDFTDPREPFRPPGYPRNEGSNPFGVSRPRFPQIGGSDLDPFGSFGGGGMYMDPSSFGIPARPSLPEFGIGGPGGLPRGAVPPGARFDPFMPPIRPDRRGNDDYLPPSFEDFM